MIQIDPQLTIVIPCYNEEKNMPELVAKCEAISNSIPVCFILVNNGSKDDTGGVIAGLVDESQRITAIDLQENEGYGNGILRGLENADTKYVGWSHADLQTDLNDLRSAFPILNSHPDSELFIKGKRSGRPISDTFFTMGMSILESAIFRRKLWDINAQPTIFSRSMLASFTDAPKDFSLDLFSFIVARSNDFSVHRIPVKFHKRKHGVSSWNTSLTSKWKFIKRTMKFTLELRGKLRADNQTSS